MEGDWQLSRRQLLQRTAVAAGALGIGAGAQTVGASDRVHEPGDTIVSAWAHARVGHAREFKNQMGTGIATIMDFDHWNMVRLRGKKQGRGYYQDIIDYGYIPHIVWNGPDGVETDAPWPEGSIEGAAYQEGGARHGQLCQDIVDGLLDDKLTAMAQELAQVDSPVLWNPWEEANGGWRPSIYTLNNGPSTWVAAWRYMYDLFEQEGRTTSSGCWHPAATPCVGTTAASVRRTGWTSGTPVTTTSTTSGPTSTTTAGASTAPGHPRKSSTTSSASTIRSVRRPNRTSRTRSARYGGRTGTA